MTQYVVVVVTANGKSVETDIYGPFPDKNKATTYAKIKRARQATATGISSATTAVYVSYLYSPTRPQ